MDVAIAFAVAAGMLVFLPLLALSIVRDMRNMRAAEAYWETQNRLARRLEALPPFDRDRFWTDIDEFRAEVSR